MKTVTHASHRKKLPDERASKVHKFKVGGQEGYLTVGFYADESPGEIFLRVSKMGSTVQGFCNSFAIMVSIALQYGVPPAVIASRLRNENFPPHDNMRAMPDGAPSIVAFVARQLEKDAKNA